MMARSGTWKAHGRKRQAHFRDHSPTISDAARTPRDEKGMRRGHLLALGYEDENLFPGIRGPVGANSFFTERGVKWWKSPRSGDDTSYNGPTRNLVSSQIACMNFLLPLEGHPWALVAILRTLDADVESVVALSYVARRSSSRVTSTVEFEWVGCNSTLEGGRYSRGAHATSADALLVADVGAGRRRAYLFEWKHIEEYRRSPFKGAGTKGATRIARYGARYGAATSPLDGSVPLTEVLYDPFYQLVRLALLGQKMVEEREFGVAEAKVVVVCPVENREYRGRSLRHRCERGFPSARPLRTC